MSNDKPGRKGIWRYLLIAVLCSIMLIMISPKLKTIHRMDGERNRLEQEKIALEKKNQELKDKLSEMDSTAMVEKIAREQLGMVKKGEKFIIPLQEDRD